MSSFSDRLAKAIGVSIGKTILFLRNVKRHYTQLSRKDKRAAVIFFVVVVAVVTCIAVGVSYSWGKKGHKSSRPTHINPTKVDYNYRFNQPYTTTFNDLNDVHLQAANLWGIQPNELEKRIAANDSALYKVESDSVIRVDELRHSKPYLVPAAYFLLYDIATDFQKALDARNIPRHRLIVTSITRTLSQRAALSKVNNNAADNSAHCYGTTFDISWVRYDALENKAVGDDVLKRILASILYQYQKAGRCYIKHEKRQACFHITVIGTKSTLSPAGAEAS